MWLNEAKYMAEYAKMGPRMIEIPATNFSKSFTKAAIFPFAAERKNNLISTMQAAVIASPMMNGIRIVKEEVRCFRNAMQSRVKGTGMYVAVAVMALAVIILLAFTGNVFAYSSPCPSALSNARGINSANIPPVAVATRIVEALRTSRLVIRNATMMVSRTGRAKKKAVAGFREDTLRSFTI